MNEKELIIKEEGMIKQDHFIVINFRENSLPEEIDRKDVGNYFKPGDIVKWKNESWKIKGVETFATFVVYDCGLLIEKINA